MFEDFPTIVEADQANKISNMIKSTQIARLDGTKKMNIDAARGMLTIVYIGLMLCASVDDEQVRAIQLIAVRKIANSHTS